MSPKRDGFNRKYVFQPLIFRGHSSVFRGAPDKRMQNRFLLQKLLNMFFQQILSDKRWNLIIQVSFVEENCRFPFTGLLFIIPF